LRKRSGGSHRFWLPAGGNDLLDLRMTGLALAACDKTVQLVYEGMRPIAKRDADWVARVHSQLTAAYGLLEADLAKASFDGPSVNHTFVTIAVTWRFSRHAMAEAVEPERYPRLAALSEQAERLEAFRSTPLE